MFPLFGAAVASRVHMVAIVMASFVVGEVRGDLVIQTIAVVLPILVLIGVLYLSIRTLKAPGRTPFTENEKTRWARRRAIGKAQFILLWGLGFAIFWGTGMLLFDYFLPLDAHAQPHGFDTSVTHAVVSTTIGALFFGFFMSWITWLYGERRYRLPTITDDSALLARRRRVQLQVVIVVIVGVVLLTIAALLRR